MTYEEAKLHADHDIMMEDNDGDIELWCNDCRYIIETWDKPTENTWHGTEWANVTGGEPLTDARD